MADDKDKKYGKKEWQYGKSPKIIWVDDALWDKLKDHLEEKGIAVQSKTTELIENVIKRVLAAK